MEDTVVSATLEVNFAETSGIVSLCYPFRSLTTVAERLNAKHGVEEEQKAQAAKIQDHDPDPSGNQIPLQMSASLGTVAHITMNDLMQLKRGDVLLLNREIDQPIELEVGGKVRFSGRLGARHGHTAVIERGKFEQRVTAKLKTFKGERNMGNAVATDTLKALIVDPDAKRVNTLVDALKNCGYAPVTAEDEMSARMLVDSEKFDVVLCYDNVANGTVLDVMKSLKEAAPDLPLIVISDDPKSPLIAEA